MKKKLIAVGSALLISVALVQANEGEGSEQAAPKQELPACTELRAKKEQMRQLHQEIHALEEKCPDSKKEYLRREGLKKHHTNREGWMKKEGLSPKHEGKQTISNEQTTEPNNINAFPEDPESQNETVDVPVESNS